MPNWVSLPLIIEKLQADLKVFPFYFLSCDLNSEMPYINSITQLEVQLEEKEEQLKKAENDLAELRKSVSKFLSETQMDNLQYPTKRPKYTIQDISKSMSLYTSGPKCYKTLRKRGFPIPAPSTLRKWSLKLSVEPGILYDVLQLMRSSEVPLDEKIVVLSFDEMKVREEWAYDKKNDEMLPPKSHVQVVTARSLKGRWKQPVYYGFDENMTEEVLNTIIMSLYEIGFTVVATVCDLGVGNQVLWKKMEVNNDKPYFTHPSDSTKTVFSFSDAPHLVKLLRNHYVDDGFIYKNTKITKNILVELLHICNTDLTILPKFHIDNLNAKGTGK